MRQLNTNTTMPKDKPVEATPESDKNKDPITELTAQFAAFVEASDKRFAAIESAMKPEEPKVEIEVEKEVEKEDEMPTTLSSLQDSVKELSTQLAALAKLRQFGKPTSASPSDDSKVAKPGAPTELSFVTKVREFMANEKLSKSEAILRAVRQYPTEHSEFNAAGATGQKALRTL